MDDLLSWLKSHPLYPKIYWKSRENKVEIAAAGAYAVYDRLPHTQRPVFGGMRFTEKTGKDPTWKDFPSYYFFEPLEIKTAAPSACVPYKMDSSCARCDTPSYPLWEKHVHAVLASPVDKVVLARRTSFQCSLDPFSLLRSLIHPQLTCFLLQLSKDVTFLGATPERLYRRKGRHIESEALAGTRPKDKAHELLDNLKECTEFTAVKTYIHEKLSSLCSKVEYDSSDKIIYTAHLAHKYHRFAGLLKDNPCDRTLLNTLHPTPAIAGTPREDALSLIQNLESFDRGWYAGAIGWASPSSADFAVAIRSALVTSNHLHAFTGAGIVAGASPESEWQELEMKLFPFMRCF